jgi:CO/xanthine dehydrogenase Mo-binding subunit
MEPHTAIAQVDGDGVTIWTSTSQAFGVRQDVADVFHVPLSKVRVHVNFVGTPTAASLGVKSEPLVAALARKAQRPVRVGVGR